MNESEDPNVWYVRRSYMVREDQAKAMAELADEVNWSATWRNAIDRKLAKLRKEKLTK